ncbi:MAG: 30S ribosomal protein S16 [Bacteroidetes bacterium SW_10_40_5]|nr:MAG: 30S ribosomal protein S16 [Bacteroidetes bacterium SW_10_40_5]
MPVRLRLQRRGRKKYPTYRIIASEAKKPRDGRFIDMLGYYNPHTNPATIQLDNEKALEWLQNGAQASPTVNRILSYKGVKYRKHLLRGVKMGVLSQEEADDKYVKWLEEKAKDVEEKVQKLKAKADEQAKAQLEAEVEANKKKAEAIQAKKSEDETEGDQNAEEGQSPQSAEGDTTTESGGGDEANQDQTEASEAAGTSESVAEENSNTAGAAEAPSSDESSEEKDENNT